MISFIPISINYFFVAKLLTIMILLFANHDTLSTKSINLQVKPDDLKL